MKKAAAAILFFGILLMPCLKIAAKIVVSRDKDGTIVISNTPSHEADKKAKKSTTKSAVPQPYLEKIKKLSQEHQLREKLIIAVARAESSFNPLAVSRKGAVGIMQLMKHTAADYGVKDRYDVDQNLAAGVKHLKYLYEKYQHNIPLTLAAYNAGEEAVKKYKGVPPYKETRVYIRRVMEYMGLSYSGYFNSRLKSNIYKYVTKDGKVIITDTLPAKIEGTVTLLD